MTLRPFTDSHKMLLRVMTCCSFVDIMDILTKISFAEITSRKGGVSLLYT